MFKRTISSVIVSGFLLGAAGAYAAEAPYPTAAREHGSAFMDASELAAIDVVAGYQGRGSAFPASPNETGSAVQHAEQWPKLDINPDRYVGSPFPSASNETGSAS